MKPRKSFEITGPLIDLSSDDDNAEETIKPATLKSYANNVASPLSGGTFNGLRHLGETRGENEKHGLPQGEGGEKHMPVVKAEPENQCWPADASQPEVHSGSQKRPGIHVEKADVGSSGQLTHEDGATYKQDKRTKTEGCRQQGDQDGVVDEAKALGPIRTSNTGGNEPEDIEFDIPDDFLEPLPLQVVDGHEERSKLQAEPNKYSQKNTVAQGVLVDGRGFLGPSASGSSIPAVASSGHLKTTALKLPVEYSAGDGVITGSDRTPAHHVEIKPVVTTSSSSRPPLTNVATTAASPALRACTRSPKLLLPPPKVEPVTISQQVLNDQAPSSLNPHMTDTSTPEHLSRSRTQQPGPVHTPPPSHLADNAEDLQSYASPAHDRNRAPEVVARQAPSQEHRINSQPEPSAPSSCENSGQPTLLLNPKRQFWHAGEYEIAPKPEGQHRGGIEHTRVHPKFLHSNATSHKWALGAVAELLDNAMDEVGHGATMVNVDMLPSPLDSLPMLLVQDDGGGMSPDRMRCCVSLGYSEKSKAANTIGQYGNGFKTSTMRLGADVLVFSRSQGTKQEGPTQSVGMLSFTFLRETGHEDTVVPMIDYRVTEGGLKRLVRGTVEDWESNLGTIIQWSPFRSESELLQQFGTMGKQGTRIIVYNLWLDDEGKLELDFDTDPRDIQVRGPRDEKLIRMADKYPNSQHFLKYRHSLRSYAAILYLRRPAGFQIILRGEEVEHHDLVNDLMYIEEVTYRPKAERTSESLETNMVAAVKIGFVKDAKEHIDVQGFNVYHKNRLIKPFWRIWNAAGSSGRGIVGVLEANFVEPAHDKQGFERTQVLQRLEGRLLTMQKQYWNRNCSLIGYSTWTQRAQKATALAAEAQAATAAAASGSPAAAAGASGSDAAGPPRRVAGKSRSMPPGYDPSYHPSGGTARMLAPSLQGEESPSGAAAPDVMISSLEELGLRVARMQGALSVKEEATEGGSQPSLDGDHSQQLQEPSPSQQQGMKQMVDADWLTRLLEEIEELRGSQLEVAELQSQIEALTHKNDELKQMVNMEQSSRQAAVAHADATFRSQLQAMAKKVEGLENENKELRARLSTASLL